jgi:MoaA/NifB/PqqE/SkfB family radical SAM enzyme
MRPSALFSLVKNAVTCFAAILEVRFLKKKVPFSVNMVLTYRCTQNCLYCGCSRIRSREMSTDEILRLIGEMADAGTRRLGFTGGEPLLREDIEKIIRAASQRGITTTLCSNGMLVPEKIGELKGLDFLILSLDGPPEIHDGQRGAGTYEKVIAAVRAAVSEGIKVWVVCVLTRSNVEHVDFLLGKAEEEGFEIFFNPVSEYGLAAEGAGRLVPERDDYRRAINKILERKTGAFPVINSPSAIRSFLHPGKTSVACRAGSFFCAVSPDGKVYPCYPFLEETESFDALEMGFKEAFEKVGKPQCAQCRCGSHLELNFLSDLNAGAIFSMAKSVLSLPRSRRRNH